MENFNTAQKYYNLIGKYTESKREFKKYMKKELGFYRNLHKCAVETSQYGCKTAKYPEEISNPKIDLYQIF